MTRMRARMSTLLPLLVVSTVILTGCFRQADDSFEPVSVDDTNITPTVAGENADNDSDAPIVTVNPDDTTSTDTDTGTDAGSDAQSSGPTPTTPLVVTVAVTNTPPPVSIVTTTPDDSENFITPGSPGLAVTNTPDPNAEPTAAPTDPETGESTEPTLPPLTTPVVVDPDCVYVVQSGDTLYRIALSNDTSVDRILAINPELGSGTFLLPGDEILIPDCEPDGESDEVTATPTSASATESPPTEGITHTVRAGETLYGIAIRYGVTVNSIINANPDMGDPNRLSIGQTLIIPVDAN